MPVTELQPGSAAGDYGWLQVLSVTAGGDEWENDCTREDPGSVVLQPVAAAGWMLCSMQHIMN